MAVGLACFAQRTRVCQCSELTFVDTVATNHAATVINGMRLKVDTGRLAVLAAERTVLTLIGIETDLEP